MVTIDEDVMRSIATAAVLILNGKDPAENFADYSSLPTEKGRAYAAFKGQNLPSVFGPMGTFLVPSVAIEWGAAPNDFGVVDRPVILSLSRKCEANSVDREIINLGQHSALLRDFVFRTGQCPVYEFEEDSPNPVDIIGIVVWAAPALRHLPVPFDRMVMGGDFGGWLKKEYHFTVHYQITDPIYNVLSMGGGAYLAYDNDGNPIVTA